MTFSYREPELNKQGTSMNEDQGFVYDHLKQSKISNLQEAPF